MFEVKCYLIQHNLLMRKARPTSGTAWSKSEDIALQKSFYRYGKYWNAIYNKLRRKLPGEVRERIFSVLLPRILNNECDEVPHFLQEYLNKLNAKNM
jgi:hypothetical protein